MSDTNLDKCFWVYPDSATAVPPGEPRTFQLVIPEAAGGRWTSHRQARPETPKAVPLVVRRIGSRMCGPVGGP